MYSKLQWFMLGGLCCAPYALAMFLFLYKPFWFLWVGFFASIYFFIVLFAALACNLVGVGFKDLP